MHFYRYVRPLQFNEQRVELETKPHGGICLRFDEMTDGLSFTHARCHSSELFSKSVARRIVDARGTQLASTPAQPRVLNAMNALELTERVIESCRAWNSNSKEVLAMYYKLELTELATALDKLLAENATASAKAEIWKAGLAAINYTEKYRTDDPYDRYEK